MAVRAFFGTWEVTKFTYNTVLHLEDVGLEGVKFSLDENGDVTWIIDEELKSVPLFNCETYELYSTTSGITLEVILRFGAYAGHVIEFRCDENTVEQLWTTLRSGFSEQINSMQLTCEGWCTLYCQRINSDEVENRTNISFSFLPALEDGYFADIIIKASNKKEFKVHSNILQLLSKEINWQNQPPPFSGLPENVLGTILHFIYTECLPISLDESTAQEVVHSIASYNCLAKLTQMCQVYLKNMALKQQIIGLVNDMHASINQVIEHFNKPNSLSPMKNISSSPANLCFILKQSVRDTVVVGAKLLLLCDLFTKRKNELSRKERHEIIIYAKSRLPIFLTQLLRFLQAFKATFSTLTPTQRQDVATYLVPEIEIILDSISMLIFDMDKALLKIIQVMTSHESSNSKSSIADTLGRSLKNVLHLKEITNLRNIHEQITCALELLLNKKDNFNEMTQSQKIRTISRNLEQVIDELPMFLTRLEELTVALDDKLEWREFKFCFKVGASKVSGILSKLVAHRDSLQDIISQICELIQREAFTHSMLSLNLLNPSTLSSSSEGQKENFRNSTSKHYQTTDRLNLVESLCVPPTSSKSTLAKLSLQLFKSGIGTDMEFEVVSAKSVNDHTLPEGEEENTTIEEEKCTFKAHRIIVAARCDWFRRALLSGMREAIDKKIVIYDTNPHLFQIFLEYLYCGKIRQSTLNSEQFSELLLLSDRYEVDSLKQVCEYGLQSMIEPEIVWYYLSMADQLNARILRDACMTYIANNHKLMECEHFYNLPIALQAEIFDNFWTKPQPNKTNTMNHLLATADDSLSDIPKALSEISLEAQKNISNCSSIEDIPNHDAARLDQCIIQIRDIIGETATREKLVQVILAADYDLCRAINYFYAKSDQDE